MGSDLVVEPVEYGGKTNEAVKGNREFFVAGRDAAVALDPAEEVFDHTAMPVKLAIEVDWLASTTAGRDAGKRAGAGEIMAEAVGVEAAVRDRPLSLQARLKRGAGPQIMLLSRRKVQTNRSANSVHHGRELGVEAALGAPHGLVRLAADRVRGVPVHLDMRAVDAPDCSNRASADRLEQPRPQAARIPAAEASVDAAPGAESRGKISPRDAGAQHVPHCCDHNSIILPRSAPLLPPVSDFRFVSHQFY